MKPDQDQGRDRGPGEADQERAEVRSADAGELLTKEEVRSCVDRLQRLQAEFENYKKRMLRETAAAAERISDQEVLDFLPLYDNLKRAFQNYNGNKDAQAFVEGVERVFAQFAEILKQKGVSPIQVIGQLFDPARHEALLGVQSDQEPNVVLEEFETGYLRNGRVLRPSKVKVSNGKGQREETT